MDKTELVHCTSWSVGLLHLLLRGRNWVVTFGTELGWVYQLPINHHRSIDADIYVPSNGLRQSRAGTNTCPHSRPSPNLSSSFPSHPHYYFQHCPRPTISRNCRPLPLPIPQQSHPSPTVTADDCSVPYQCPKALPSLKVNWNTEKWECINTVHSGSGWWALITSYHCCNSSFYFQTCVRSYRGIPRSIHTHYHGNTVVTAVIPR